jgi:nucleotide-binding universal stress UspA family protein
MFKRVLVPLDGSSFGEAALGPAAALARRTGGEVRLLNVHEPGWYLKRHSFGPEHRRWREDYLSSVGRGLFDVKQSASVRQGTAEQQILEEVECWGAEIIVMSTHGRGGVSRLWLGSVADHCVRRSNVPVLLIRARPSGESNAGPIYLPRRLVVPLDGSELAEGALVPAVGLSETLQAPIALVRVVPRFLTSAPMSSAPGILDFTDFQSARAGAASYLDSVAARLRDQGTSVTTELIVDQAVPQGIIDEAAGDLIVMSTHSRPPAQRAVLGSVTDKVVRGSRGPVVVIPAWSSFVGAADTEAEGEAPQMGANGALSAGAVVL